VRLFWFARKRNSPSAQDQLLASTQNIKVSSKGATLVKALAAVFKEFKRVGATKKAVIFTDNKATVGAPTASA
jgi:hypothetical protein